MMKVRTTLIALMVLMLLSADAVAYTLVLRTGERVEIGETYRLTGTTVEYLTATGGRRSLDLKEIDLSATARVNNEPSSTFIDRAMNAPPLGGTAPVPEPDGVRLPAVQGPVTTVTNSDLESYRIERERSEAAYRLHNPDAYAPRPDEVRRREVDRSDRRVVTYGGRTAAEWQALAQAYRDDLDTELAQIGALRDELATREANPFDYRLSYRYNYGNAPLILGRSANGGIYNLYPLAAPSVSRADAEFYRLSQQLQDLELQHRGTLTRWHNLLNRARRAGVPPGLLRE